jgi:glycosyltransferase involved in cell wall biosynthesis
VSKKSKKKISLFIPSMRGGGAEKVFLNLSKGFLEKGHEVDLLLAQKEGEYLNEINEEINVVDLGSRRLLFAVLPLIKYLKKGNPDVLISGMSHVNIISLLAKMFSRVDTDIIVTEHNPYPLGRRDISLVKKLVTKMLMRLFYPSAKTVVTVSRYVRDNLIEAIGISINNFRVIYNPMDLEEIRERSKEQTNHKWLRKKELPIILGVGRLTEEKDFPTLVKAFAKVRKKLDAKLIILGEGERRGDLEQLILNLGLEEDVDLPGFVKNPYSYMAASDVFVLSSLYEGFGNVLVEAMACGTSVVSTKCPGGPSEILENGKWGELVPVEGIEPMANAIMKAILNQAKDQNIRERSEKFSLSEIVDSYLGILDKVKVRK